MEKLKFKTAYTGHERCVIPTGDGMEDIYMYEVNKYGRKELVNKGQKNLYAEIQAAHEETKIENLLARAAGGENVFRPDGIYADLTQMPSNLIEARQTIQNLENLWNGLDKDMRNKYNNSLEDFIASSDTKEWAKDMGLVPMDDKIVKEVKGEETPTAGTLGQVGTKEEKVNE